MPAWPSPSHHPVEVCLLGICHSTSFSENQRTDNTELSANNQLEEAGVMCDIMSTKQ